MLAKLTGDAQLAGVGIRGPFAEHRVRPLLDHLEDFRRYLAAKDNTADHVSKTVSRCRAVLEGIDAETFEDLQPSAVVEFLAELRRRGAERPPLPAGKEWFTKAELVAAAGIHPASVARMLRRDGLVGEGNGKARLYPRAAVEALRERMTAGVGVSTTNHYLTAAKGFTHWLVRDRRFPAPCTCLAPPGGISWPFLSKRTGRARRPAFVAKLYCRTVWPSLALPGKLGPAGFEPATKGL